MREKMRGGYEKGRSWFFVLGSSFLVGVGATREWFRFDPACGIKPLSWREVGVKLAGGLREDEG